MSDELKPCPFCGCEFVTRHLDSYQEREPDYGASYGKCNNCGATAKYNMWNTRTPDPSLTRILKLAAVFYKKELWYESSEEWSDEKSSWFAKTIDNLRASMTPEDIALLKEISL
jgi:hypothetical protein